MHGATAPSLISDKMICAAIVQGNSGISKIDKWDASTYSTQFAGEIKELDVGQYINKKMARRLDDVIKYTIVAGKKVEHRQHFQLLSVLLLI